MKLKLIFMALSIMGLSSCCSSSAQAGNQEAAVSNSPQKALVVYFSWGGNTRTVAKNIGEIANAEVFELLPAIPYTRDRDEIEEVAKREVREGVQPPLKALPENLEQYDVIYVGSPCWFTTIAPPVATFMATAELSGKTIVPFMTHGGNRMGKSVEDMKRLAPKANVTEGLPISESRIAQSKEEITIWLRKNNLIK